jgi:hypothetical protein
MVRRRSSARPSGELIFDLYLLVALCRWCHDQTDAPYERGRLVVIASGGGQFAFEVVQRSGPGTPPARVPAFAHVGKIPPFKDSKLGEPVWFQKLISEA